MTSASRPVPQRLFPKGVFKMSDPTLETAQALTISSSLIQFATENKSGLATDVIAKIEAALEAQRANEWSPQIAAEFWNAYDKLCSHLKPVTVDTFRGAQLKAYRPLGQQGPTYQLSWPQLCAWMFSATLFALLVATAFSLFVASAGDTLITEIDALKTQGDSIVKDIRVLLVDMPADVSEKTDLTDWSLPRTTREWAHKLNDNVLKLFSTSDHLYQKANAAVFRILRVKPYEDCSTPNVDQTTCYRQGGLTDQAKLKELNVNLSNFFNYFETRRAVENRRDQAATRLQVLKVSILPALLGMLGACTYVVRMISEQVRDCTFTSTSGLRHLLRVVLGSIVGIIITVLWTKGTPEGISVSALSFVAGYSIEPVFATFDFFAEKFRK